MIALRDYQQAAMDGLFKWWADQHGENPLLVLPTAAGKTILFSAIIQKLLIDYKGTRILILAHRKELIEQAEDKLLSVWPQAPIGIFSAGLNRRELAPVTIASRDTIANCIGHIGQYDLVFVDEAHNIAPGEETRYRKIINTLHEQNPNLHVIGFTATPYRTGQGFIYGSDEKHLFQGVAYEIRIRELLDKGYLAPVTARTVNTESVADTSEVKTTAGDFNQKQLETVVTDEHLIDAALSEWERLAYKNGRQSTVFFCVSVLHAELVSEKLHERGIPVPVVSGETPKETRERIITDFADRKIPGIANCAILTEGTDIPAIDCIALMRPTKSLGLYIQMTGRGMRLYPGKDNCLVLDFGGCIDRFGPIDIAQPMSRKKKDQRTKVCPKCETINGIFKRKCESCGYQFAPNPVKICEKCEEENHPSAAECVACGKPFINHERKAANGGILSTEQRLQEFDVEEISCQTMVSHTTGNPYLKMIYRASLFEIFFKNLMIGYEGYAGKKAVKEWTEIARGSVLPTTPAECMRQISKGNAHFRPVESIIVDMRSKYRDIVRIKYREKEAV